MDLGFDTPLSQINFFPDLMQVCVLPDTTDVIPALVHLVPDFTAAWALNVEKITRIVKSDKNPTYFLFMD